MHTVSHTCCFVVVHSMLWESALKLVTNIVFFLKNTELSKDITETAVFIAFVGLFSAAD